MAYIKSLFKENFLYYASYVIKDRAIPEIEDGLKPVQRRIMHTLFEMDDGKYHKVANVVGSCMKYHPHGDASIYSALVVLANKSLFIDRQGNFGNILTGDEASAARYIECKAAPLAKDIFYNPKITEYEESYDGRNREPVVFPAKVPVVLLTGAEGIAVGMSTRILPHNPLEVLQAEIDCLQGKEFVVTPDFQTGGIVDVTDYQDGMGRVRVRATIDTSDPKRIVIRDVPYGVTTESLMSSIDDAAKAGRLKIASINDYTTDKVEIEIKLARGVYAEETVDALYAFTQCEQSISCNLLVIKDGQPTLMTVTDVIRHHAKRLLSILKAELDLQIRELLDEIHARTLERIFIEERVYKAIETMKTQATVIRAVLDGLAPFASEIKREVSNEDFERLLKIPIRRISLYDIEKAKNEMERLKASLKEARHHLANLTEYGIAYLKGVMDKLAFEWKRKTKVASFDRVAAREVARRDVALRYDVQTGYLGTSVSSGDLLFSVSPYDRLLVIRRNGLYTIIPVPERLFVDKGMLYCGLADKEKLTDIVFTVVYTEAGGSVPLIKRCQIEAWILARDYELVPDGSTVHWFTTASRAAFVCTWSPKPRFKIDNERFRVESYPVKGLKARGIKLSSRSLVSVKAEGGEDLFEAAASPQVRTARPAPKQVSKPAAKKAGKAKSVAKSGPDESGSAGKLSARTKAAPVRANAIAAPAARTKAAAKVADASTNATAAPAARTKVPAGGTRAQSTETRKTASSTTADPGSIGKSTDSRLPAGKAPKTAAKTPAKVPAGKDSAGRQSTGKTRSATNETSKSADKKPTAQKSPPETGGLLAKAASRKKKPDTK